MAARQRGGSCRDLLEHLHDGSRRREKGPRENRGIALLAGILPRTAVDDLRLTARRDEMPKLMSGRLGASLARVVRIEKNAGSESVVECKQAGNPWINAPHIDAHAHFQFQERHDVSD